MEQDIKKVKILSLKETIEAIHEKYKKVAVKDKEKGG